MPLRQKLPRNADTRSSTVQYVYIDKPLQSLLPSDTKRVATVFCNKPLSKAFGPYNIRIVRNNTLTILQDGIQNTIHIDRSTKAPGLQDRFGTNCDGHHTRELSQTQTTEASKRDNGQFVVDEIVYHVTEYGDTKYVLRRYGYHPEEDTVELTSPTTTFFYSLLKESPLPRSSEQVAQSAPKRLTVVSMVRQTKKRVRKIVLTKTAKKPSKLVSS